MPLDLTRIGRMFFGLAMIGLGVEHFIFGTFVTGRAPVWPEALPGGTAWAYVSGLIVVATGAAVLFAANARGILMLAALLIAVGALLRHIPVLTGVSLLSGPWTPAGKALTFVGGALTMAATYPVVRTRGSGTLARLVNAHHELINAGRVCLAVFLVMTGIQHFMFTAFVVTLIPRWFPGNPWFWTYFAGVALIAGGIGLMVPFTARLAALMSGLMVFSWFWIVHIPRTFVGVSDSIAVFEALAVSGIALVLSEQLPATLAAAPARDRFEPRSVPADTSPASPPR